MVDRGRQSFDVVQTIKELTEKEGAIALLGNHEDMMITYAKRGVYNKQDIWLYNGGMKTMDSYEKSMKMYGHGQFFRAIAKSGHLRWLAGLLPYYETDKVWFSHAPIPAKRYRETGADDFRRHLNTLIWSWHGHWAVEEGEFLKDHGKTAVYGHVHRLLDDGNMEARVHKNGIYIDSGCGCAFNAPLTAAIITDGKYQEAIQAWPLIVETRTVSNEDKRTIWTQA
jgi:serine/threonine protein phosphatase 1